MTLGFEGPVASVLACTYYIGSLSIDGCTVGVGNEEVDSDRLTGGSRVE